MPEGDSASMMGLDNCFADQSSTNVGVIAMADLSHDDDGIAPVIVSFCRKNHAGVNEVHDPGITRISFTSGRAVDIGTNGVARGVGEGLHKIRNDARAQTVTRDQDLLNASSGIGQVIVEGLHQRGKFCVMGLEVLVVEVGIGDLVRSADDQGEGTLIRAGNRIVHQPGEHQRIRFRVVSGKRFARVYCLVLSAYE